MVVKTSSKIICRGLRENYEEIVNSLLSGTIPTKNPSAPTENPQQIVIVIFLLFVSFINRFFTAAFYQPSGFLILHELFCYSDIGLSHSLQVTNSRSHLKPYYKHI